MKEKMKSLSPALPTREGAKKSLPCGGDLEEASSFDFIITRMGYLLFHAKNRKKTHSFLALTHVYEELFLAKRCFLLGFIVKWWYTTVGCLWMGVKACLQTTIREHNTSHQQDGNNKYKLFFLFLSK
ncbi:MAG: hypothetical protein KBS65_02420 [Prevotella sp.]|nr:hypothetical protein [Candidatus Equicola stercoris]